VVTFLFLYYYGVPVDIRPPVRLRRGFLAVMILLTRSGSFRTRSGAIIPIYAFGIGLLGLLLGLET